MSLHYSELIGCNLVDDMTSKWNEVPQRYSRKICITHSLTVCHCGWELGEHYGPLLNFLILRALGKSVQRKEIEGVKLTDKIL